LPAWDISPGPVVPVSILTSTHPTQYIDKSGPIAARGIVEGKVKILSLLQKHVFEKKGPSRGNMLPIWTCMWILILNYRESLFYYDNSGRETELYQLAQHMYNILVSLYSRLF
jgi:hypothetical protein